MTAPLAGVMLALLTRAGVPALHPLYTDADLLLDLRLVGTWVASAGGRAPETWTVERYGDDGYQLRSTRAGVTVELEGRLVRLGEFRFLDLTQRAAEGAAHASMVPAHTFNRIWIEDDYVRVAALDARWLKQMLAAKQFLLGHEVLGDAIVITAGTATLQRFALKFADDPLAFSRVTEWKRQVAPARRPVARPPKAPPAKAPPAKGPPATPRATPARP